MTPRTILLLSASIGAGHDRPARELARRLNALGHRTEIVDLVEVAPLGRTLRWLFRFVLAHHPHIWGRMVADFEHSGQLPAGVRVLIRATGRRIARMLTDDQVDQVISTFPLGGKVVAHARTRCPRSVPLTTYLTDPAVHTVWLDDATDLYLTTWTFTHAEVRTRTTARVELVAPAIGPGFNPTPGRRHEIDLSDRRPIALVGSGSWGVGDVLGTVHDLLQVGTHQPVVVCGHNHELRRILAGIPGIIALGWVQDMPALMRSSAIAVLNSGGLTLAETAAIGLPVLHHRPLPGQGELNARACRGGAGTPLTTDAVELAVGLMEGHVLTAELGTVDPIGPVLGMMRELETPIAA